jgi:hypothetical protein
MTTSHELAAPRRITDAGRHPAVLVLCLLGAGLMVASGAIHLHLWNQIYRHVTVGHMNVLFMVQSIASFVGALALLVWRRWFVVLGCAALMLGTAIGYLITRYHSGGLFGFYLGPNFSSSDATWSLITEFTATGVLVLAALALLRGEKSTA